MTPFFVYVIKADMRQLRQVTKEEVEKMCREYNFTGWAEVSVKDNLMVADAMM